MKDIAYREFEKDNLIHPEWLMNILTFIIMFCLLMLFEIIITLISDKLFSTDNLIVILLISAICISFNISTVRVYSDGRVKLYGIGHLLSLNFTSFNASEIESISFSWQHFSLFRPLVVTKIKICNKRKIIKLNIKDYREFCNEIIKYNPNVNVIHISPPQKVQKRDMII